MPLCLETLTSIIRTGETSGRDRHGKVCYYFVISNDLTQMVNFPTQIPDWDSHSLDLLDFFISSDTSIWSGMAFTPLENPDHVVGSVAFFFSVKLKRGCSD